MVSMLEFTSLTEMIARFPNEQSCIDYMTEIRWRNGKACPYCGSSRIYTFRDNRTHKCADCRQKFSIKVGTIFEDSKIPLQKWFIAIYLLTAHKKGISSVQLGKDIGVTQKTAWFMNHRLREAARTKSFNAPLKNTVEADETYVGGKEKNKHASKKLNAGRGTVGKSIGMVVIERGGEVRAFPIPNTQRPTLNSAVQKNVALGAKVYTDEHSGYDGLESFYTRARVNHGGGLYVIGDCHTNTAESFFALFKRGLIGIYHKISPKHLSRYLNEFSFRYNIRAEENGAGLATLLCGCSGRLTYKELTANEAA